MRLSARPIVNYANINNFSYANQWIVRAGDPLSLYFQLVDLDQGPYAVIGNLGFSNILGTGSQLAGNVGLRYMTGIGSPNQPVAVQVTFHSIDNTTVITVPATLADASDPSIFKISIPSNQVPAGGNVQISVGEGNAVRRFGVLNMLTVEFPLNDGSC